MSALLEAHGLRRRFRSGDVGWLDVLLDVDLTVRRGEVIAVAGTSGSGKSTLLHLLGALDRASGGEIVLDGTSYSASLTLISPVACPRALSAPDRSATPWLNPSSALRLG